MSYVKTNWQNDQAPAINATNLNKIEQGIFNNDANISGINGTIGVDTNTWVGTTAYGKGDIVIYNDKIYQNISGTSTTTNPAEDTTNWDEITIFDTDSINDDLIDKTKFINNSSTNSGVKTYSCNYINNSDSYSTNEVKTNKRWIDGKPIYRKVIKQVCDGGSIITINHNISNLGEIIKCDYFTYASSTNTTDVSHRETFAMSINRITPTQLQGSIATAYDNSWELKVILEYTKTTD